MKQTARKRPVRIKFLLLLSSLLAISLIGSSAILMGVAMKVQSRTLTEATLQDNFEGARNLNISINKFKDLMFRELGSTARFLSGQSGEDGLKSEWLGPLLGGPGFFNAAIIVGGDGEVLAATPESGYSIGERFEAPVAPRALREPGPRYSDPFRGPNGHRMVLVSHPMGQSGREPHGFIGGFIDLEAPNIYSDLFGHAIKSKDGSFAYIVDRSGEPLLSPDGSRVGEVIPAASLRTAFGNGVERFAALADANGDENLVGYLTIPILEWGIVFQSSATNVDKAMDALMKTQLAWIVPLIGLLLLLSLWMASRLAAPFAKLTAMARRAAEGERIDKPPFVKHWNYEAYHLARAMTSAVRSMQSQTDRMTEQALTDSLTGLTNRTGLERWMGEERDERDAYALLVFDIDDFKKVNDVYGHLTGDEALKQLARVLSDEAPESALVCRFGGEEFVMLLPKQERNAAWDIAERIRQRMENAKSPTGKPITVSAGLALYPDQGYDFGEVFEHADQAMYQAKRQGRNRTVVYGENPLAAV